MYLNDRSVINRIRLADNLASSPRPICVEPSRSTVRSANHSGPCRLGNQWNSIRVQVTTHGGCCGLAVRQTNRYPITRAIRQVHPTRALSRYATTIVSSGLSTIPLDTILLFMQNVASSRQTRLRFLQPVWQVTFKPIRRTPTCKYPKPIPSFRITHNFSQLATSTCTYRIAIQVLRRTFQIKRFMKSTVEATNIHSSNILITDLLLSERGIFQRWIPFLVSNIYRKLQ